MRKVIIIGSPGAGKSTFARKLREKTGLPLYYLDSDLAQTGSDEYIPGRV